MKTELHLFTAFVLTASASMAQSEAKSSAPEKKVIKVEIQKDENGKSETIVREYTADEAEGAIFEWFDKDENGEMNFHHKFVKDARPYLGIKGYTINGKTENPGGIRIMEVMDDSPARTAGLQNEDILRSIDGEELPTYKSLIDKLAEYEVGETVAIVVEREGVNKTYNVKLGERDLSMFPHAHQAMHPKRMIIKSPSAQSKDVAKKLGMKEDVSSFDEVEFKVRPNPSTSVFNYELTLSSGGEMEEKLMDSAGKIISEKTINSMDGKYSGSIDLNDKPAGTYILIFRKGDKLITERIVKK